MLADNTKPKSVIKCCGLIKDRSRLCERFASKDTRTCNQHFREFEASAQRLNVDLHDRAGVLAKMKEFDEPLPEEVSKHPSGSDTHLRNLSTEDFGRLVPVSFASHVSGSPNLLKLEDYVDQKTLNDWRKIESMIGPLDQEFRVARPENLQAKIMAWWRANYSWVIGLATPVSAGIAAVSFSFYYNALGFGWQSVDANSAGLARIVATTLPLLALFLCFYAWSLRVFARREPQAVTKFEQVVADFKGQFETVLKGNTEYHKALDLRARVGTSWEPLKRGSAPTLRPKGSNWFWKLFHGCPDIAWKTALENMKAEQPDLTETKLKNQIKKADTFYPALQRLRETERRMLKRYKAYRAKNRQIQRWKASKNVHFGRLALASGAIAVFFGLFILIAAIAQASKPFKEPSLTCQDDNVFWFFVPKCVDLEVTRSGHSGRYTELIKDAFYYGQMNGLHLIGYPSNSEENEHKSITRLMLPVDRVVHMARAVDNTLRLGEDFAPQPPVSLVRQNNYITFNKTNSEEPNPPKTVTNTSNKFIVKNSVTIVEAPQQNATFDTTILVDGEQIDLASSDTDFLFFVPFFRQKVGATEFGPAHQDLFAGGQSNRIDRPSEALAAGILSLKDPEANGRGEWPITYLSHLGEILKKCGAVQGRKIEVAVDGFASNSGFDWADQTTRERFNHAVAEGRRAAVIMALLGDKASKNRAYLGIKTREKRAPSGELITKLTSSVATLDLDRFEIEAESFDAIFNKSTDVEGMVTWFKSYDHMREHLSKVLTIKNESPTANKALREVMQRSALISVPRSQLVGCGQ